MTPDSFGRERPLLDAGVVAGNVYDKYGTANPVARLLVKGFLRAFDELLTRAHPENVLEVGCGEGELAIRAARAGFRVEATDISPRVIQEARGRAAAAGVNVDFQVSDLFALRPPEKRADLVVCCEVLEHVADPEPALAHLLKLSRGHILLSVPREPIWRVLNMLRLRYLRDLGNTPGHVNHWSRAAFVVFVEAFAEVVSVASPFPWTMVLARVQRSRRAGG